MPEEEKDKETKYITLKLKDYVHRPNRTHAFYTTFLPGTIMEQLSQTLKENCIELQMSEKTWKATSTIIKPNTQIEN